VEYLIFLSFLHFRAFEVFYFEKVLGRSAHPAGERVKKI
jgi:hypothetical protein